MASRQSIWGRCCRYGVFRPPNESSTNKLMPTDHFKFEISIDCQSIDDNFVITTTHLNHFSNLFIACKSFFREGGRAFLRTHLSHPHVPSVSLHRVTEAIITKVQQSFEFDESFAASSSSTSSDHHHHHGYRKPKPKSKPVNSVFPLFVKLIVAMWEVDEVDEDYLLYRARQESMQEETRMTPASVEAIESRQKEFGLFKLPKRCNICLKDFEGGDQVLPIPSSTGNAVHLECLKKKFGFKFAKQCSICLEDFDFDGVDQVLPMPCGHVFHQHCLVHWLHTSHTCPLCRFSMPTAANN